MTRYLNFKYLENSLLYRMASFCIKFFFFHKKRYSRKFVHSQAFLPLEHTQAYTPNLYTTTDINDLYSGANNVTLTFCGTWKIDTKENCANPSEICTTPRMFSRGDFTNNIYWVTIYSCLYIYFKMGNIIANLLAR